MSKEVSAKKFFDGMVQKYEEVFMEDSRYFDTIDRFCVLLGEKGTLLELGCGPGNLTKYICEKYPEIDVLGTDISPKMLEAASRNAPDANFQRLDIREVQSLNMSFDGILCGFGLPYLNRNEVEKFILEATKKLKKGGIIYLSTMEDVDTKSGIKFSSSNRNIGVQLYYHQGEYILEAMKGASIEIIMEERRKFCENDGDETMDLFIIGKKLR